MATSVSRCDWSSGSTLTVGFCYGNRANYVRKVIMGFWMLSFHNHSCQKHEWHNSAYGFTSALAVTEVHLIPIYCSARILPAQQLLPRSSWNSWSKSTRGDICAAKRNSNGIELYRAHCWNYGSFSFHCCSVHVSKLHNSTMTLWTLLLCLDFMTGHCYIVADSCYYLVTGVSSDDAHIWCYVCKTNRNHCLLRLASPNRFTYWGYSKPNARNVWKGANDMDKHSVLAGFSWRKLLSERNKLETLEGDGWIILRCIFEEDVTFWSVT
jgi:hypothetical protein